MTKISREEVLRIARTAHIALREDEVVPLIQQLEQVLSYAERVRNLATNVQVPSTKNVNVFRKDFTVPQHPEILLAKAPEREGNYFVVPVILDH